MEKPLPKLNNFRAVEAESEVPEPWYKRYYAYAFIVLLATGFCAGEEFLRQSGVLGQRPLHIRSPAYTIEESNAIILGRTLIGGVFGFVVSFIGCVGLEKQRNRRGPFR